MPTFPQFLADLLSGGLGGAGTGAAIGGPVGAGIGGILGAGANIASRFANEPSRHHHRRGTQPTSQVPTAPQSPTGNILTGLNYGDYTRQLPRFSPAQEAVLYKLLQQGLAGASPEAVEQRARTQFEQQTIPTIAERFTSMGSGAQSSPAFAQTLGQAGADLEERLAALRSQYALAHLGLGLSPLFDTYYVPGTQTPGLLNQAASTALSPENAQTWANLIRNIFSGGSQMQGTQQDPNNPATPVAPVTSSGVSPTARYARRRTGAGGTPVITTTSTPIPPQNIANMSPAQIALQYPARSAFV